MGGHLEAMHPIDVSGQVAAIDLVSIAGVNRTNIIWHIIQELKSSTTSHTCTMVSKKHRIMCGINKLKSNFWENPRNSCRRPYFTKILTEREGQRRWRPEGPTPHGGAARGGPRGHVVWPRPASDAPFGLLIGFENAREKSKSPSKSRHIALRLGRVSVPDSAGEEITAIAANASPSTSHVSPIHV
ncbi:hypothetical protein QYE76_043943 [Lolium multiflorum]|uniref:Uncharacterized protein n=1 Tax=Lolium multiflorum TaxID=4521 RepID=A0AAD8TI67_LOLMU|nr:hypothetical protein QYE76_043943 [Lolium multiflorum]